MDYGWCEYKKRESGSRTHLKRTGSRSPAETKDSLDCDIPRNGSPRNRGTGMSWSILPSTLLSFLGMPGTGYNEPGQCVALPQLQIR